MLSKPPEPAADVADVSSVHEDRPHLGPNNEKVVTQSKPPVPAEERLEAESSNTKAVTRPNPQESGASAQFSNTRDDRKVLVPLTLDKLLLFPPEPKPVAIPPTVVNDIPVKNGNRNILQLPLASSQTDREVDQDVLSSTDKHRDRIKLDRVATETYAPRVSYQLALKTNNLVSHNKYFTNLGQETKVYDKVDHRKGDVKGFTTRDPSIDTVKQSPRQFLDNKATGGSYKTRQMQMTRSVFDKSVAKRGFRKAYTSPNFTRPGMSSIQRYSDMKQRLLKQPTRISNNSLVNTTAMLAYSVLEPRTGERPIVKLSDFLTRKTRPNESTTHKKINASRSITPTTLNNPTVKQRVFEQSRIIPFLRPPEIPTTTINSTVQERAFEKYNNVRFLRQPEIPTTPISPSGPKRVSEEFNIPFFSPTEIPITLNRPNVQKKTFEKLNKTPFIEPLEISTTPNSPTVKQTAFENSYRIPFLDQPEIPGRRESPSVQQRAFEKSNKISFRKPPQLPTAKYRETVKPKAFEKSSSIPFLRPPEIPTTPLSSTEQQRVFEKLNIPFIRPPEIPTTRVSPTVQQRVLENPNKIPFLSPPEIPTTPVSPTVHQRALENPNYIPFLSPFEIPTTPISPTVQQKALEEFNYIQNNRRPDTPPTPNSQTEQQVVYNVHNDIQNTKQPGPATSAPTTFIYDRIRHLSRESKIPSIARQPDLQKATMTGMDSDVDINTLMPYVDKLVLSSTPSYDKEQTQQELLYLDMEVDYNRESIILRNGIFRLRNGKPHEPFSARELIQSKERSISAQYTIDGGTTSPETRLDIQNTNTDEMAPKILSLPAVTDSRSTADPIDNVTTAEAEASLYRQLPNGTTSDHVVKDNEGEDVELDTRVDEARITNVTGSPSGGQVTTSQGKTQSLQIEAFERQAMFVEPHLPQSTSQDSPSGPGEYGAPVTVDYDTLSNRDRLQYAEGYKQHYFNQYVSDMVSVRRRLFDDRPTSCRTKFYSGKLPEVSVIISFHNEAWSTLLRLIHSILDRSPPALLREIILVDDLSNNGYLKTPLEEYIATLVKVTLLRTTTRQGVARARLLGYAAARAPVLIFMDSHTECFPGWLEPLLEVISLDPSTVTFPVITPIDPDDFSSRASLPTHRGGFNWGGLRFVWDAIPAKEQNKRTETEPIRSPTIPGGIFAINKAFFEKLGGFDPGMMFWGGENLELSFKVWMCNGSILLLPCSQVGHVFWNSNPVTWPNREDVANVNSVRVAEVWMDAYKNYVYDPSFLKPDNYGDITLRQALRQRLRCHDFHWYMRNVYAEKQVPLRLVASGEVRPRDHIGSNWENMHMPSYMITSRQKEMTNGEGYLWLWQITQQGDFQQDNMFICTLDMTSLHLDRTCSDRHNWEYREDNTLYHRFLQLCLQANPDGIIEITICDSSPSQQWNIIRTLSPKSLFPVPANQICGRRFQDDEDMKAATVAW
ncbi:uncharacterized protein [Haliotis cracherodii]|uniref:uncharacterized protein n=1 Tax=Haliotis cracherodii TaxID=6455 RepID=UPI0039E9B373